MFKVMTGVLAGFLGLTATAAAQNYPTRPVTMIIPFAAGGPTDVLGRIVGQRMSELLGQQVVIENVGGAGGMTGSKRVADAQPDGYVMGIGTVGTHAQGQTLYKRPLYNSQTDFTPVALLAQVPIVLTVAQGPAGQGLQGVRRLRPGQPGQDAVRLGRRRLRHPSRLRAAQLHPQDQHHPHPVPRHRTGDDRAAGRPHRLSLRGVVDGEAAHRRRHRQGAGDLQQHALAGAAERWRRRKSRAPRI